MCQGVNMVKYTEVLRKPQETSPKKKWFTEFNCPRCGKFVSKAGKYSEPRFNVVLFCNSCGRLEQAEKEFFSTVQARFPSIDFSQSVYTDSHTPLTAVCSTHGEFSAKPRELISAAYGCQKCSKESHNEKISIGIEGWKKRLSEKTSDIEIISYSAIGYHEPVVMNCKHHGEFTTTFGSITGSKYICAKCAWNSHQKQSIRTNLIGTPATLYYVYLPDIDMYKLGVTIQTLNARLGKHEVHYEIKMPYEDAIELEHIVHSKLSPQRYVGTKKLISYGGNTELYKTDILPDILKLQGLYASNGISKES